LAGESHLSAHPSARSVRSGQATNELKMSADTIFLC